MASHHLISSHHHFFNLKTSISSTLCKGQTFAYMKSLHIFLNTAQSGRKPSCRNVEVTGVRCEGRAEGVKDNMSSFTPSLLHSFTSHSCHLTHLHISTGRRPTARHPIIHTLTLKPFQSVRLCLITSSTLCIPKRLYKSTQRFLSVPSTKLRPSILYHHPFFPLKTLQIFSLHRPCFMLICQHTLDTSSVYLSIYVE